MVTQEKMPAKGGDTSTQHPDITPASNDAAGDDFTDKGYNDEDSFEVFQTTTDGVNFRTVSWQWTSIIFLKLTFAVGVMGIPSALYSLGAVPGALNIVGWGALNTYVGVILGNFRNRHPKCHSVADMAAIVGGKLLKEITGVWFVVTWIIFTASCVSGVSTALNAVSEHALCTNWFSLVAVAAIFLMSSIRKFESLEWISWLGFATLFTAVFIVVVGVTLLDRPAAAPQTGDFDLGFHAFGNPNFIQGITAAATIFCSNAGTPAFLPVISEMRNPRDYNKALYLCNIVACSAYLAFSLVVYRWCGQWVATPSLGSAGPHLKKVAYGIGMFGIMVTGCLYCHISAKYIFVRALGKTRHLQQNTLIHWSTWLGCTFSMCLMAFIIASAVPIFNHIVSIAASLGLFPMAIVLPAYLWIYDHAHWRTESLVKGIVYYAHWLMAAIGVFGSIGGTYGAVMAIIGAYQTGDVGSAFSCADNSNTIGS